MNDVIDGTAYWAGHAVARPLFVPNGEALLLALPLICLQIDFYSAHNARIASAVLATAIPSVHLSVCPSHAGIVSKRQHVARFSLHRWIAN